MTFIGLLSRPITQFVTAAILVSPQLPLLDNGEVCFSVKEAKLDG